MKSLFLIAAGVAVSTGLCARSYYVAPDGNDRHDGTREAPFATLSKAQALVTAGDTVWMRGGTYHVTPGEVMAQDRGYAHVFDMSKSGTATHPICYFGVAGERPVFDLSAVKPKNLRVSGFYVSGSYLHFKNFDIVGTQVTMKGHTQSECISARGGSHCTFEHLAMHHGMAIGYYQIGGSDNLVLNCDAYCNYDDYSEGEKGGNVDGFGGHALHPEDTGNVFRGCRAWYNSDDGFDLIRAQAAYTIDHCWSFYNGYQPGTFASAGDGTGFKSGGYGMKEMSEAPACVPQHTVQHCIAYYNKNKGFYANHHLGGILWLNNSGCMNPSNFCMLNRKSAAEVIDVAGYGHILEGNVSYKPRSAGRDLVEIDTAQCTLTNNSFAPEVMNLTEQDFTSLDATQLLRPRDAEGNLPDIDFLKPTAASRLTKRGMGYTR